MVIAVSMTATELGYLEDKSIQNLLQLQMGVIAKNLQTALDAKATSNALTSGLDGKQD